LALELTGKYKQSPELERPALAVLSHCRFEAYRLIPNVNPIPLQCQYLQGAPAGRPESEAAGKWGTDSINGVLLPP
jgi:hypothetical protein